MDPFSNNSGGQPTWPHVIPSAGAMQMQGGFDAYFPQAMVAAAAMVQSQQQVNQAAAGGNRVVNDRFGATWHNANPAVSIGESEPVQWPPTQIDQQQQQQLAQSQRQQQLHADNLSTVRVGRPCGRSSRGKGNPVQHVPPPAAPPPAQVSSTDSILSCPDADTPAQPPAPFDGKATAKRHTGRPYRNTPVNPPPPLDPAIEARAILLPATGEYCAVRFLPETAFLGDDAPMGKTEAGNVIVDPKTRDHILSQKYMCTQCTYRGKDRKRITAHMYLHTGERPFQCRYCDKGFRLLRNRNRHELIHTGEKPHVCELCGDDVRFAQTSSLGYHNQRVHGSRTPHQCGTCPASFCKLSALQEHEAKHKGQRPYKCPQCDKTFATKYSVPHHMKCHDPDRQKQVTRWDQYKKGNLIERKQVRVCYGDATLVQKSTYEFPVFEYESKIFLGKKMIFAPVVKDGKLFFCVGCLQKDDTHRVCIRIHNGKLYTDPDKVKYTHICAGEVSDKAVDLSNFRMRYDEIGKDVRWAPIKSGARRESKGKCAPVIVSGISAAASRAKRACDADDDWCSDLTNKELTIGADFGPAEECNLTMDGDPVIRYPSRRWPGLIFEFKLALGRRKFAPKGGIRVYMCAGCGEVRRDLNAGKNANALAHYRIRVMDGRFYDDPDGQEHICMTINPDHQKLPAVEARRLLGELRAWFGRYLDRGFETIYNGWMKRIYSKYGNKFGLLLRAALRPRILLFGDYHSIRKGKLLPEDEPVAVEYRQFLRTKISTHKGPPKFANKRRNIGDSDEDQTESPPKRGRPRKNARKPVKSADLDTRESFQNRRQVENVVVSRYSTRSRQRQVEQEQAEAAQPVAVIKLESDDEEQYGHNDSASAHCDEAQSSSAQRGNTCDQDYSEENGGNTFVQPDGAGTEGAQMQGVVEDVPLTRCVHCDIDFGSEKLLKVHMRAHGHKLGPWHCIKCNVDTADKVGFHEHLIEHL